MLPGVSPTWSCFSPRKIIPRYRCLDQGAKRLYFTVRIQATPSLILALVTSPDIFGCLVSVIKVPILKYRCRRWEWYVTANNRLLASWRDPTKRLSFPQLRSFTILFYFFCSYHQAHWVGIAIKNDSQQSLYIFPHLYLPLANSGITKGWFNILSLYQLVLDTLLFRGILLGLFSISLCLFLLKLRSDIATVSKGASFFQSTIVLCYNHNHYCYNSLHNILITNIDGQEALSVTAPLPSIAGCWSMYNIRTQHTQCTIWVAIWI